MQTTDISIHADFGLSTDGTARQRVAKLGSLAALGTTLAILGFDLAAGLGAAGVGVGVLPVAAALAIAPCYVALVSAMHRDAPPEQRLWSQFALGLALIYATIVSLNYALQLTVVPHNPELFAGWTLELRPDSAFWALEVIGYAYMGLSGAALIPLLLRQGQRTATSMLVINGLASLLGGGAYLVTGDPGHWLAVGSLIVWALAFPVATALIGLRFRRLQNAHTAAAGTPDQREADPLGRPFGSL